MPREISRPLPEGLAEEVTRLRGAYDNAIERQKSGKRPQTHVSSEHIIFGDDNNFVNAMGIGTDKLHVVVGERPQHHGHGEDEDPNAFKAVEVVIHAGVTLGIEFSSHEWKTETVEEEGKSKKAKVLKSPSGGIQTNNQDAVDGATALLPHIK